jgi:hypothetical protein
MALIPVPYLLRVTGALSALLFIALLGCGGPNNPFVLMDDRHVVKPTSIVVISGSHQIQDTKLAELLTKELKERSRFRVFTQENIAKAVTNYPVTIKRRNVEKDEAKPIWFDPAEKRKVDDIQARLNADYVFIVWGVLSQAISNKGNSSYGLSIVGNLVEYPSRKVVATTEFYDSITDSPLALFRPKNYYIEKLLADCVERIADEFLQTTKAMKGQA